MHRFLNDQGNLPDDAGAGKPAGVGKFCAIHPHAEHIVMVKGKLLCDVIGKADITVGTLA